MKEESSRAPRSTWVELESHVAVGTLVGYSSDGAWRVDYPHGRGGVRPARSVVVHRPTLTTNEPGPRLVLGFEDGDVEKPIVLGVLQEPSVVAKSVPSVGQSEFRIDGERFEVTAQREIVMRCGESSLTLRADGKVIIRGTRVLSRASETNRIQGGSVEIN